MWPKMLNRRVALGIAAAALIGAGIACSSSDEEAAPAAAPAAASAALGACITSPPLLYHCQVRCLVLPWCGFFPLQSRVDSFYSAAKCRRFCFALESSGATQPGGLLCTRGHDNYLLI